MPKKLPYKTFLKTFELVPRVAVNLLVKDSSGQILLSRRVIQPFKNFWHIPGCFLIKGETLLNCLRRVAKEEIGIDLRNNKLKLLGVFEDLDKDSRGHIVDIVYGYKLVSRPKFKSIESNKEMNFFKRLPTRIGFNHRETLLKIFKHLKGL